MHAFKSRGGRACGRQNAHAKHACRRRYVVQQVCARLQEELAALLRTAPEQKIGQPDVQVPAALVSVCVVVGRLLSGRLRRIAATTATAAATTAAAATAAASAGCTDVDRDRTPAAATTA